MRVTMKLVWTMLALTALVFAINGARRVRREVTAFRQERLRDVQILGRLLEKMLADSWQRGGKQRVAQLVADANAGSDQMRFRWVPLDASPASQDHVVFTALQLAALRQGQLVIQSTPSSQGEVSLYVPVRVGETTPGALEMVESLAPVHAYVRNTVRRTIIVWLVMVGLSSSFLLFLGLRMIKRPLQQVIAKIHRIGTGDFSGALRLQSQDEFTELAVALNQVCEQLHTAQATVQAETEARLQALEQLRHADRLKTLGTLASGIAHELGTPLNVVSGRAGLILSGRLPPEEVTNSARVIKEQGQRMTTIIQQLLNFARRKTPNRVVVDLRTLAQQTFAMLTPLAEQHHAIMTLHTEEEPLYVCVDTAQLQQVFINLLTNAWQAMPQGGQVVMQVTQQTPRKPPAFLTGSTSSYACVSVTDQGAGIPTEDLLHLFDPFFTTKGVGQGTGLGLSVAYGIVQDHHGWIAVENLPGHGACFRVYLPMEEAACLDAS